MKLSACFNSKWRAISRDQSYVQLLIQRTNSGPNRNRQCAIPALPRSVVLFYQLFHRRLQHLRRHLHRAGAPIGSAQLAGQEFQPVGRDWPANWNGYREPFGPRVFRTRHTSLTTTRFSSGNTLYVTASGETKRMRRPAGRDSPSWSGLRRSRRSISSAARVTSVRIDSSNQSRVSASSVADNQSTLNPIAHAPVVARRSRSAQICASGRPTPSCSRRSSSSSLVGHTSSS